MFEYFKCTINLNYFKLFVRFFQVKEFRELSVSGQLSDQARRDQAAAMAVKLSEMFGLGDDSDGSDSDT